MCERNKIFIFFNIAQVKIRPGEHSFAVFAN